MTNSIKKIAITGGTHGNELTGVYLIKSFMQNKKFITRENFETISQLNNIKAIEKCTRYIDKDLNRSFNTKDLARPHKGTYEDAIAYIINTKLGPKGTKETNVDFIVDLHSTTSNMGLSIVIDNENELTWQVAAYLKDVEPRVNIFKWTGDTQEVSFVNSITKDGFAIEVGAVPQGVLRADLFFDTKKLIGHILDYFDKVNSGNAVKIYKNIEIYDHIELVDFPRDKNGDITAMIHPGLQDNDYKKLSTGDPLFITFEGETITYNKDKELHALFINEAAYYEKGFAMCLAEKKRIPLAN